MKLTEKQQAIVNWVDAYNRAHHCSPTFREVADHFGIHLQAVTNHMKVILRKGAMVQILSADGKHRGWRVPRKPK